MEFKFKLAAVGLALGASSVMAAPSDPMSTNNSSLIFFFGDTVDDANVSGDDRGSLFVDLGKKFSDFIANTSFTTQGNAPIQLKWNFVTNTFTVNGVQQAGTFNWSNPFGDFLTRTNATDRRWGVIAGANIDQQFLTTGAPTQTQINGQLAANTANMVLANNLWTSNNAATSGVSTFALAGFGANSAGGINGPDGFIGNNNNFGANYNWRANLGWRAGLNVNTNSNLYFVTGADDGATRIATAGNGQFGFNGEELTWSVTAVPEPGTYALMLAGLGVVGLITRRRRGSSAV